MSVPVLLQARAERDPDGVLIEDVRGARITNGDFHTQALNVAAALRRLGVKPGDCVVTLNDPRIEAHVCWIGICWAGAREVPVNPDFRGNSLIYGLSDSRATVLITSNAHLDKIWSVRDQLPHIVHILTLDDAPPPGFDGVRALKGLPADAGQDDSVPPTLEDPYAVIYTSGTTGPSKGVVVPWGSLQYAVSARLFPGDDFKAGADLAFYSPWPMFHSSGRTGLAFAALTGGRFIIRERLSATSFWDDIRRHQVTHTHLLGIAGFLMVQPERADDAHNPLQRVLMNPVIGDYRDFETRFGVEVSTGWGMTEIGFPTAAANLPDSRTCGRLSPLYEARIVDDAGNELSDGQVGQMVIRPLRPWLLLKEYLGKPEATAAAWRDGWFYTGDALRREPDGFYYFVDRVADYLRIRGNNVSSVELESEVRAHPAVADVAAIGVPADLRPVPSGRGRRAASGEDEIKVVVLREPGAQLDAAALLAFLEPRVPAFMLPRYVEFVHELPRTPTGKVQKKLLRAFPLSGDTWDRFAPDPIVTV